MSKTDRKGRILVGMSGGVDSAVAALLLQEQGWEVEGVTLRLSAITDGDCTAAEAAEHDAAAVAEKLHIRHRVLDLSEAFRSTVVADFGAEYAAGRTPNPCVVCNRCIKFGRMLEEALAAGFDAIATGHYVRSRYDAVQNRWQLLKATDPEKDQSYVLYSLTQHQLAHTVFPLGEYRKPQLRELARGRGLIAADRPDSQDICFIPDGDYAAFLEQKLHQPFFAGDYIDRNGTVLGTHRGMAAYTIGQRKGLGVAFGEPRFVIAKDAAANTVTLGRAEELFATVLVADTVNWLSVPEPSEPMRVSARARYHQTESPATVEPCGADRFRLLFDQPQRALTPGQTVVLYRGDTVIGGGRILQVE